MYRIFCESYYNYIKEFENSEATSEYRYKLAKPLKLMVDPEAFHAEKKASSLWYKQTVELLYFMHTNIERYPKFKAFLWTLDSRGITGMQYGVSKPDELEEQAKLVNMMLNLAYWHAA